MATNTTNKKAPVRKSSIKPKTRVGGSSLARKKQSAFSARKGFIAAGLVAIVGLVAVAFSMASGVPSYQYTIKQGCSSNSKTKPSLNCYAKSAEGFTYLMYQGVLGRAPESQDVVLFWSQKLAGDRTQTGRVIDQFMATNEGQAKLKSLTTQRAFVNYLYKNFTGRTVVSDKNSFWVKQLTEGKKTRSQVINSFIGTSEAIKYHQAGLLALKPVTVTETAKREQAARAAKAQTYAKAAEAKYKAAKADMDIVKARRDAAGRIAGKAQSQISQNDIKVVNANLKDANQYAEQAAINYVYAQSYWNKVKVINNDAQLLTDYAKDISDVAVRAAADKTRNSTTNARNASNAAKSYKTNTQQFAAEVQRKYDAEQARLAEIRRQQEEAARQAALAAANAGNGGGSGSGSGSGGGSVKETVSNNVKCDYNFYRQYTDGDGIRTIRIWEVKKNGKCIRNSYNRWVRTSRPSRPSIPSQIGTAVVNTVSNAISSIRNTVNNRPRACTTVPVLGTICTP